MTIIRSIRRHPLAMPLLLYGIGAVLSALSAYDPRLSVPWLETLALGMLTYGIVVRLSQSQAALGRAVAVIVAAATALALFVIVQYRHLHWSDASPLMRWIGGGLSGPFPQLLSPLLTANVTASILEGALPAAVGLALSTRRLGRAFFLAAGMIIALALALTESRGAWVALSCVGMVGMLARLARHADRIDLRRAGTVAIWMSVLASVLLLALAFLIPGALASVVERAGDRLVLYRNSFYLALDFPFSGIGGGTPFAMTYSIRQLIITVPYLTYAHNLLLSIWLAHGLLGLVGFLALVLAAGRLVVRSIQRLSPVALGAVLGSLAHLIHGISDAPQYDQAPAFLSASAIFGAAIAGALLADRQPLTWLQLGRRAWAAVGIVLVIALALTGPNLLARASSNAAAVLHNRASLTMAEGEERLQALDQARAWTDIGLRIDPHNPAALKARGMIEMSARRHGEAITALEQAAAAYPRDQAVLKSLAYAYIWYGYTEKGARLLRSLDRAGEAYQELGIWQQAWRERGREDLAQRARAAQAAFTTAP